MSSYSLREIAMALGPSYPTVVGGRLERQDASTLVWSPLVSSSIGLYNGSAWDLVVAGPTPSISTSGLTVSGGGLTLNTNYDVYAYYQSSSSFSIQLQEWAGNNSRYETPDRFDGILVRDSTTTEGRKYRFLGIVRLNSSGEFSDIDRERFVWNFYNRQRRSLWARPTDTADRSYGSSTWREYNGGSAWYRAYFLSHEPEEFIITAMAEAHSNSSNAKWYISGLLNATNTARTPRVYNDADATYDNFQASCTSRESSVEGLNYMTMTQYARDGTSTYEGGYVHVGVISDLWC